MAAVKRYMLRTPEIALFSEYFSSFCMVLCRVVLIEFTYCKRSVLRCWFASPRQHLNRGKVTRHSFQSLADMRPFIEYTTLDLSKYSMEVGKMLTPELKGKVEERRKQAILIFSLLSAHLSDTDAVTQLIKHLFAVLKGMEICIDMNMWSGNRQSRGQANSFACDIINRSKVCRNRSNICQAVSILDNMRCSH